LAADFTAIAFLIQRRYLGRRRFSTAARGMPPELVVRPWLRRVASITSAPRPRRSPPN
jgi:hypothetical protein